VAQKEHKLLKDNHTHLNHYSAIIAYKSLDFLIISHGLYWSCKSSSTI
jgi:hypothetical protein